MSKNSLNSRRLFGDQLRKVRLSKSLTQEQLATQAGLDRTYISSCERGKRNVTLAVVYKLAEVLLISPKELIPDKDQPDEFS